MSEKIDNKYLAKTFDLEQDDFWEHPQSGKWIITHHACMKIADQKGIVFERPEIIVNDIDSGRITLLGYAYLYSGDDKIVKWTHGEVNPKNCFIPYPWAVAEKRLKDRLTLMLVSVYGHVYSEVEAQEFEARQLAQD
tara:strand:+ start:762 stop:1172 length:411 start_codon:yes stop_codon:yes gene_type:complete